MPNPVPPIITERLLQFIWQFKYFNKKELITTNDEVVEVIHPGYFNTNQGPDFLEARIKKNNVTWAGNIEMHVMASDWLLHHHSGDANYNNVILHVVWLADEEIKDQNDNAISTLELQPLVSKIMLQQYEQLMQSQGFVPCENRLPVLSPLACSSWKERLIAERLQQRSAQLLAYLQQSNNHWEEVFWRMLARNFGVRINADNFENIAESLPVTLLAKHKNQVHQLEAFLFGQANLLNKKFKEDYPKMLQREYRFLKKKYDLKSLLIQPSFLRMRPANFPTLRLAQLAILIHNSTHLFSKIKEINSLQEVKHLLNVTANDYWHYHYNFDEESEYKPKQLGEEMINNIIINTVTRVLFAYGLYTKEQQYKDKALEWLSLVPPENNRITKAWKARNVSNNNALDSQALLQLKTNYCDEKRCLDCAVGNKLLNTV
jgi:hypothetical protein